ncbi:MAG: hypothetical protein ACXITV_01145 [Luteibaculaceae bacterium]
MIKKIALASLIALFCVAGNVNESKAQAEFEGGLRFGNSAGASGVGLDFTFPIRGKQRFHTNLGFGNNSFGVAALYNLMFQIEGNLYFYPGIGLDLGVRNRGENAVLGIPFELGLEYKFQEIPFTLGVDWRPRLGVTNNNAFTSGGFGLSFRYRFK